jgi:hypothetical protein
MRQHGIMFDNLKRQTAQFIFRWLRRLEEFGRHGPGDRGLAWRNLEAWNRRVHGDGLVFCFGVEVK